MWPATKEIASLGLRFVGIYSPSATELGTVTIDYIYLGPEETLPSLEQPVYGYDSHYMGDSKFSDGSSLYVEGKGVPNLLYKKDAAGNPIRDANGKLIFTGIDYGKANDYTETSFTFQGTGFDIISRTGAAQGALRIIVLDANGNIYRNNSVLNKSETNLELYQVPVATERDLPYGKYTVKIFANAGYTSTEKRNSTEANCIAAGYSGDIFCLDCGITVKSGEVIPALGHRYNDGEITAEPSSTEGGVKTLTCSICGNTSTEVIPATGHVNTSVNTTDATCTEAGSVVVTCACGEVVSTETVAPLGHSYGTPVDNGNGTHTAICFCSDAFTNEHNFVEASASAVRWRSPSLFWTAA